MIINAETAKLALSKNIILNTQAQIQTYLRNEKNLHVDVYLGSKSFKWEINNSIIDLKKQKKIKWPLRVKIYDSYEDALEICLQEMLKLI